MRRHGGRTSPLPGSVGRGAGHGGWVLDDRRRAVRRLLHTSRFAWHSGPGPSDRTGLLGQVARPLEVGLATTTDTALAVGELLQRAGTTAPYPRMCLAHGGGTLLWAWARIRSVLGGPEGKLPSWLFFDTAGCDLPQMEYLLATAGPGRVLFGSDQPGTGDEAAAGQRAALRDGAARGPQRQCSPFHRGRRNQMTARRVVTGHDGQGRSVVVEDSPVQVTPIIGSLAQVHTIWGTTRSIGCLVTGRNRPTRVLSSGRGLPLRAHTLLPAGSPAGDAESGGAELRRRCRGHAARSRSGHACVRHRGPHLHGEGDLFRNWTTASRSDWDPGTPLCRTGHSMAGGTKAMRRQPSQWFWSVPAAPM